MSAKYPIEFSRIAHPIRDSTDVIWNARINNDIVLISHYFRVVDVREHTSNLTWSCILAPLNGDMRLGDMILIDDLLAIEQSAVDKLEKLYDNGHKDVHAVMQCQDDGSEEDSEVRDFFTSRVTPRRTIVIDRQKSSLEDFKDIEKGAIIKCNLIISGIVTVNRHRGFSLRIVVDEVNGFKAGEINNEVNNEVIKEINKEINNEVIKEINKEVDEVKMVNKKGLDKEFTDALIDKVIREELKAQEFGYINTIIDESIAEPDDDDVRGIKAGLKSECDAMRKSFKEGLEMLHGIDSKILQAKHAFEFDRISSEIDLLAGNQHNIDLSI